LVRIADFFAMDLNLRNGVFVSTGDMNNDGRADVVVGAGEGGAPRVRVFTTVASTPVIPTNQQTVLYDFYAGNPESRSGIRVTTKRVNTDKFTDIVTGEGTGREARVRTVSGGILSAPGTPTEIGNNFIVFSDLNAQFGAYVG
jgi:hypothetical protein